MSEDAVTIEIHAGGWAEVVLNRPARKNAITGPLGESLAAGLLNLNETDDVKVILLRGAGGGFCSGLDVKAFNAEPARAWAGDFPKIWRRVHKSLFNSRKPLVAALEGYAINGGAALALACDLLIVADSAFLQVGEAMIGMPAPYNQAWLSLRHSESVMAEIALLGERLNGKQLLSLGVAQRCVPDDEVVEYAAALCHRLAAYPEGGLGAIKRGLRARLEVDADQWFDRFMTPGSSNPRSMKHKV